MQNLLQEAGCKKPHLLYGGFSFLFVAGCKKPHLLYGGFSFFVRVPIFLSSNPSLYNSEGFKLKIRLKKSNIQTLKAQPCHL